MKYILVLLAVVSAVVAQVLVKNASTNVFFEKRWILSMLLGATCYFVAFLLQSYILKFFPLSKITPVMAIAIMTLVFGCGIWLFNEQINTRQFIGVLLGMTSIYLILS